MIWNIITDSACDLKSFTIKEGDIEIRVSSVPFVITVDDKEYIDDENIDLQEFQDAMLASKGASKSACPAPFAWEEKFKEEGNTIAVTISKNLSGSYNSACVARDMVKEEMPNKNITVVNSKSTGSGLTIVVRKAIEKILEGASWEEVEERVQYVGENKVTVFALNTYNNLIKNGRIPKAVGLVAQTLKIWGVGVASEEGEIDITNKIRGAKKAARTLVGKVIDYPGDVQDVIITHVDNEEMAQKLVEEIKVKYPNAKYEITPARGLDCFYAEKNGLVISFL